MQKEKVLATLNILAFGAIIVVNGLANLLPINGLNTGEVSALYPSLFTPAGITFSIWSLIYLLLTGFVIIQWKIKSQNYFIALSYLFIASCALNASWILAWHNMLVGASVVIMVSLLITLTKIFLLLKEQRMVNVWHSIFLKLPFTIYLGWICVATIANVSAFLVSINWHGGVLTETQWTVIMMSVAMILVIIFLLRYEAYSFAAVVIWALIGIGLKQITMITQAAIILIVVIVAACILTFLKATKKSIN